jgi:hypothetical protein
MYRWNLSACSLGLSATSQQYFSLRTNQPPATSRNQPTVLFSQNKPAPAISHQPTEQAVCFMGICWRAHHLPYGKGSGHSLVRRYQHCGRSVLGLGLPFHKGVRSLASFQLLEVHDPGTVRYRSASESWLWVVSQDDRTPFAARVGPGVQTLQSFDYGHSYVLLHLLVFWDFYLPLF